ncbi:MAG: cysteine hydrolase [Sphingomonadales bacterium]|nr:cysteine hydrolase [Sphingomonadales bacterium]MDE2570781.1 cysteine hydrolase [Sphingomonadales bacterium]
MHTIELPRHLLDGTRPCFRFEAPDPQKTALLVIDLQAAFVDEDQPYASQNARDILLHVNAIIAAARGAGALVVFTRASTSINPRYARPDWFDQSPAYGPLAQLLREGRAEHAISSGLEREPADLVIDKYRSSAMLPQSCDLAEQLRARGIDTLIIVGAITNYCCENTARDACQMDFKVFFITDATAAMTDAEHNAALGSIGGHADLRSTAEMIELLQGPQTR